MNLVWTLGSLALIGCGSVNGADLGTGGRGAASTGSGATTTSSTDPAFTGPSVCASGITLPATGEPDGSMDGDGSMDPGMACLACHATGPGPRFALGGTVFATGHVPDLCEPTDAQSNDLGVGQVVITDATGATYEIQLDGNGNFHYEEGATIPFPYRATVSYMGKDRPMLTAQTSGDCNACHTDAGLNGAPGRVALPE
jgi:hypothetical protein